METVLDFFSRHQMEMVIDEISSKRKVLQSDDILVEHKYKMTIRDIESGNVVKISNNGDPKIPLCASFVDVQSEAQLKDRIDKYLVCALYMYENAELVVAGKMPVPVKPQLYININGENLAKLFEDENV